MAKSHSPTLADLGPRRRGFFWWFGVVSLAALVLVVVLVILALVTLRSSSGGSVSATARDQAISAVEAKSHGRATKTSCYQLAGRAFCTVTVRLTDGGGCQKYSTADLHLQGLNASRPAISKVGRPTPHC